MRGESVTILLYHGVDSGEASFGNAHPHRSEYILSQPRFEEHVGYLQARRWRVLPLHECAGRLAAGETLRNAVVLTFDDGEASCYHTIAPILERCGLRGDFFIVSRLIGAPGYLTAGQIKELSGRDHGIHSHSASHRSLTLLDHQELEDEVKGSKERIETVTGKAVSFLSVPNGAYNRRVLEAARRAGYQKVLSSVEGYNGTRHGSFVLKRFAMRSYTQTQRLAAICEHQFTTSCQLALKHAVTQTLKSVLTVQGYDWLRSRIVARMSRNVTAPRR